MSKSSCLWWRKVVNFKLVEEMSYDLFNMSQAWGKEKSESPTGFEPMSLKFTIFFITHITISTLLILAVYKTLVIHEPCMWPSSQRVLRSSVVRASDRCTENQGSNPVGESRRWIVKSLLTKWSKQGLHSPLNYSRIYSVWYLFVHLGKRACLWTDSFNLSKWFVTDISSAVKTFSEW